MPRRRRIIPGASYRLTARCFDRRFYLVPSEAVDATVGFVLAYCAQKYAVQIHAWVVMSNHVHLDITDPHAKAHKFIGLFKSLVARALNCKRGRWEYFWAPPPSALVRVVSKEDAIKGLAYTLVNPVAAGLVWSPDEWPGRGSLPGHLGATKDDCLTDTFDKPDFFFRTEKDRGKLPDRITLTLTPHPMGADDPEGFVNELEKATDQLRENARRKMTGKKRRPMGADNVRAQKYWRNPGTRSRRRRLIPTFAAKSTSLRVQLARQQLAFDAEYDSALLTWLRRGKAVFPFGTCKMKGYPGVTVRGAPAAA